MLNLTHSVVLRLTFLLAVLIWIYFDWLKIKYVNSGQDFSERNNKLMQYLRPPYSLSTATNTSVFYSDVGKNSEVFLEVC